MNQRLIFVSNRKKESREVIGAVERYLVDWIKHPDPGSAFERNTRLIRWLPGWILIILLELCGYDGVIILSDTTVIGHCFFQKHRQDWRAFSVFVKAEERGKQYAQLMHKMFLEEAYKDPRILAVRIGAGGNEAILRIWKKFIDGEIVVPCTIEAGTGIGWIRFLR